MTDTQQDKVHFFTAWKDSMITYIAVINISKDELTVFLSRVYLYQLISCVQGVLGISLCYTHTKLEINSYKIN